MESSFWKNRRVLVTGHTGFKGSWLTLWLTRMGAQVTGYALSPPTQPSLFEVARVGELLQSVTADINDLATLKRVMAEARPEIVMHLAAQPLVHAGYDNPVETYQTNVMGTVHVLEAARSVSGVRAVLNVTTDKCYENREWLWGYREIDRLGGFDPYSNSKACSELITQSYRNAFFPLDRYTEHGVAVASARAGNVIGGGDWGRDRLVPDILRAVARRQMAKIRRPSAVRPWQHVLEPLSGYLMLARKLVESGPDYAHGWNFGPIDEDARPVSWIADRLTERWGEGASWEGDGASYPHEAQYLKLDCSQARDRLGWRPRLPLTKALEWIVEWHRAHAQGADMRAMCHEQIDRYLKLAHP
jgi:CDP-glucose 4,6-dehydratase